MPTVSVLLPCYNAAATLEDALESMACQTLADFEVVVVDDGSTDASPQILHSWAARDPRLRILRQDHAGIVAALNRGLQACTAPLVARMDADDRAHPARLAQQAAYLEAHPETVAVSCQVEAFPAEQVGAGLRLYLAWQNSLLTDEQIRAEMFVESPLVHPSVIFRREPVLQAGGYQDPGWPEDYDLWLRLYLAGAGFARLEQVLLSWREGPARLTRLDGRYSADNFLRAKAHYLALGPLAGCDAVFIWGAGLMGRGLSKHLLQQGVPLAAFADVDPRKIGRTRRGLPVLSHGELLDWLSHCRRPVILAAVGTRGARPIVRRRFELMGLREAHDWWFAA